MLASLLAAFVLAAAPATTAAAPAAASAPAKGLAPALVDAYLAITTALAADKMDGVADNVKKLGDEAEKAGLAELAKAARAMKTGNISDARTSFKAASEAMVTANKAAGGGLKTAYCPMAKAHWLQTSAPVRNPFYGASMLECGRIDD
jgi:hypothetical protein